MMKTIGSKILAILTRRQSNNNIGFIHTDLLASRTEEELNKLCNDLKFEKFKKILCVSDCAKKGFVKIYPDFDVRNYGFSKLSTFCQDLKNIKLIKRDNSCLVTMKTKKKDIYEEIRLLVAQAGKHGIEMGTLGRKLKYNNPGFNVKSYGFSQFSKFIKSLDFIEIQQQAGKTQMMVYLKVEEKVGK